MFSCNDNPTLFLPVNPSNRVTSSKDFVAPRAGTPTSSATMKRRLKRFWSKVSKNGPVPKHVPHLGKCWIWIAGKRGKYGTFWHGTEMVSAHRYSYEEQVGKIPPGMFGLHRCDNHICVRPSHIFAGTQKDNALDCLSKGRHQSQQANWKCPSGKNHPFFKFTNREQREFFLRRKKLSSLQVKAILRLYHIYGVPPKELGIIFGVSVQTIMNVREEKSAKARQLLNTIK